MSGTVETRSGRIRGTREGGLHVFRGIPYARPPVGARRFAAPEPEEPWAGVRAAESFGGSAPQRAFRISFLQGFDVGEQSEDCLYLNVTTPGLDGAKRPVLVWIHGGAFSLGSGSQAMYETGPLVGRGDVVMVTLNYRLGALGFSQLEELLGPDWAGSGNRGIQDQIAALGWVRQNIERFGGDPDNVTIFGESAGGMSVGTLLGTPGAAGLFHRAVPQSGAAHNANRREVAAEVAEMLLAELGIPRSEAGRLREVPAERLVEAQEAVTLKARDRVALLAFQPVVDGSVLPALPIEQIRAGLSRGVPVLVGSTRDEWKLFGLMDPGLVTLDDEGLRARLRVSVGDAAGDVVESYRRAREGREPTDPRSLFFAIESDRVFRIPAVRLAEAQRAHQESTFKYLFTWESPLLGDMLGACHGVDVPFVFGLVDRPGADKFIGSGEAVRGLADRTMDAWLRFSRGGDPAHEDLGPWPAYCEDRRATMLLGPSCEVAHDPLGEERAAWDGLL